MLDKGKNGLSFWSEFTFSILYLFFFNFLLHVYQSQNSKTQEYLKGSDYIHLLFGGRLGGLITSITTTWFPRSTSIWFSLLLETCTNLSSLRNLSIEEGREDLANFYNDLA